jgi:hypothetical protein
MADYSPGSTFFEISSPAISDLDQDGILEIVIGGYEGLFCFGFTGITSSGETQWSTHRGSNYRTGQMDADSDYMDDLTEEFYGTNSTNPDSDSDALTDTKELFVYDTNPWDPDSDNDHLSDGSEVFLYLTSPTSKDSDSDALMDDEELFIHFTDPTNQDSDNDSVFDGHEVLIFGTNPNEPDSDSDLMDDGWEISYGTDPLIDDSVNDTDNDNLTHLEEYTHKTHPFNADTDMDQLLDGDEVKIYGTSPLLYDSDFDGYSDYIEISSGTDPNNPDEHPPVIITYPTTSTTSPPTESQVQFITGLGIGIGGGLLVSLIVFALLKKKLAR